MDKKLALFHRKKVYDLKDVKKFSIDSNSGFSWRNNQNQISYLDSSGTLKFEYGLKTIKLAGGIDEAEARYLMDKLKAKRILREDNYS